MSEKFTIEYIEEFSTKACTNAHHCAMLRQLLVERIALMAKIDDVRKEALHEAANVCHQRAKSFASVDMVKTSTCDADRDAILGLLTGA